MTTYNYDAEDYRHEIENAVDYIRAAIVQAVRYAKNDRKEYLNDAQQSAYRAQLAFAKAMQYKAKAMQYKAKAA